ncbi:MerR family transcriptional regulator [Paenibacillus sp. B2(2019)]|uniref:MerR family transcriptional regulator n=1 Tax=Paenibacillus sp. B2(2019) TaxID=2607754 RepID=UPI0011F328A3|nr:helix-turn-helix domain-containing protein [Paenibacillus sp. B2(2019)]KAA1187176.1 MerR family transcriptional regulator [Paenibacillus sp. B2(2019)]
MNKLFSIGEVTEIKEVSIKALRYYHKMGILIPRYIDPETGYRYYSIDQFIYIDVIKGCRSFGTSIKELQEIFKESNTDKLIEFLQLKRQEAEEKLKQVTEVIQNIDNLNKSVESSKEILNQDQVVIQFFEKRYVLTAPYREAGSLKELLYYSELEKTIRNQQKKMTMERGILYMLNTEGKLEPRYVFHGFEGDESIGADSHVQILPEGRYVTLAYRKENEVERVKRVLDYIEKNSLNAKKYIEIELYNDLFDSESYSCQIQILIENDECLV